MTRTLHYADQIVIIGYFVLLAAIGLYFWRRMKHVRDLFTGGNNIPWWLAGVSFYLTAFSAFTFVTYSEIAYRYGLVSMILSWSSAVAMLAGTIFLAGRWRRARIISPVEFLEARYSPQMRQVFAWVGIPFKLLDDGLKIYATGIFLSAGLGYDLKRSVLISGVVMLLYTFMGGLWAVVITDYVQFVILTIGVAILFPLVMMHMGGGIEGVRRLAHDTPPGFLSPVHQPFSPLYIFAFYVLVLLSYNGNWAFAQKFYSVRDERASRKAGMLATILKLVGPPLFILPAMAGRSLMPELMNSGSSPQYTYAMLSVKYLPAGLFGLMIAAMFSATMSTLSADFNVTASVLTEDVYHRLINLKASQRRLVLVGRLATLFAGAVTVGIGVILVGTAQKGLFEVMVTIFGLFVGPMLIPMLIGLLNRRVTWRGAAGGMICGFSCAGSLYLYKTLVLAHRPGVNAQWLRYDFEAISILANFGVTLLAIWIITVCERPSQAERAQISHFFAGLDTPISSAKATTTEAGTPVFTPLPIVGWATAGVGLLLLGSAATLPGGSGQFIDIGVGIFLCTLGAAFHLLNRRVTRLAARTALSGPQRS
jgi:solute:Na+ symporter, SSS family